jgi:hypothetical protein
MAEILRISQRRARDAFKELAAQDYLERVERGTRFERWSVTIRAMALVNAHATHPLRRETAERQLAAFLERHATFNANDYHLVRVPRVAVFGSYLSDMDRLGDVDIALWWVPRAASWPEHCKAVRARVRLERANGRVFQNIGSEGAWDEHEMLLTLKARQRAISLHVIDRDEAAWWSKITHRVLYEEPDWQEQRDQRRPRWPQPSTEASYDD